VTKIKDQTKVRKKRNAENAKKSLDEYFGFMNDLDRDDWFSVYINSIARFDPHTNILRQRKRVLMSV
jgi:carboxyl-terminal processing protease